MGKIGPGKIGRVFPQPPERGFDGQMQYFSDCARIAGVRLAVFSMFEVTDMEVVPYPGCLRLRYGDSETEIPPMSSYVDLLVAADKLMGMEGDFHHVFVEGFIQDEDGLAINMVTGS